VTERTCTCGCGESLRGRSKGTRYFDARCRDRAYRRRLRERAEAAGIPGRLSVKRLDSILGSGKRRPDAARPTRSREKRPRVGLSIWLRGPDALHHAEVLLAVLERYEILEPVRDATRRAVDRRRKREAS
jgi:hypothetical protein